MVSRIYLRQDIRVPPHHPGLRIHPRQPVDLYLFEHWQRPDVASDSGASSQGRPPPTSGAGSPLMGAVFAATAPDLHARGLNIIPIIPGTKTPGRGCKWKVWQTARQSPADIEELVRRYPKHEVSVILGMPRAALADIETDGPEGDRWLADSGLPLSNSHLPFIARDPSASGRGAEGRGVPRNCSSLYGGRAWPKGLPDRRGAWPYVIGRTASRSRSRRRSTLPHTSISRRPGRHDPGLISLSVCQRRAISKRRRPAGFV